MTGVPLWLVDSLIFLAALSVPVLLLAAGGRWSRRRIARVCRKDPVLADLRARVSKGDGR